eukprot:TRINITY_DN6224_c0_g1_i1.p1 TRINITY_DN6224_c0_g1~~TRINITY_DN6224_c0_g1_i1.p1  ORF type:complete len:409 (+),score=19.82 TRINITY_DN6224_c0_g1_i1:81-1307(+)
MTYEPSRLRHGYASVCVLAFAFLPIAENGLTTGQLYLFCEQHDSFDAISSRKRFKSGIRHYLSTEAAFQINTQAGRGVWQLNTAALTGTAKRWHVLATRALSKAPNGDVEELLRIVQRLSGQRSSTAAEDDNTNQPKQSDRCSRTSRLHTTHPAQETGEPGSLPIPSTRRQKVIVQQAGAPADSDDMPHRVSPIPLPIPIPIAPIPIALHTSAISADSDHVVARDQLTSTDELYTARIQAPSSVSQQQQQQQQLQQQQALQQLLSPQGTLHAPQTTLPRTYSWNRSDQAIVSPINLRSSANWGTGPNRIEPSLSQAAAAAAAMQLTHPSGVIPAAYIANSLATFAWPSVGFPLPQLYGSPVPNAMMAAAPWSQFTNNPQYPPSLPIAILAATSAPNMGANIPPTPLKR